MSGKARFRVTPKLIAEALQLPDGARVFGCEWDFYTDSMYLYVLSPDIKRDEAGTVRTIVPKITSHYEEKIINHWLEWEWNGDDE